jgi:diguanylate cyclase (GGDEF)-like protein
MADIDHFKAINDQHGHLVGDSVLESVARSLQAGLRESDLAVRWGGEEFLMVLKNCEPGEAVRIADNLRQTVMSHPVNTSGQEVPVSISIGVTQLAVGEMPSQAIDRADAALYRAKESGRNRVVTAAD